MELNDAVEIRPVGNGYMVMRAYDMARGHMRSDDDILVFQSWAALEGFLREHFTLRCFSIPPDIS